MDIATSHISIYFTLKALAATNGILNASTSITIYCTSVTIVTSYVIRHSVTIYTTPKTKCLLTIYRIITHHANISVKN